MFKAKLRNKYTISNCWKQQKLFKIPFIKKKNKLGMKSELFKQKNKKLSQKTQSAIPEEKDRVH